MSSDRARKCEVKVSMSPVTAHHLTDQRGRLVAPTWWRGQCQSTVGLSWSVCYSLPSYGILSSLSLSLSLYL